MNTPRRWLPDRAVQAPRTLSLPCPSAALIAALFAALLWTLPARAAPPLVDGDWLAARLGDANVVVLDVRNAIDGGSRATYLAGHIPGAVHSDYLKGGWRTTRGGVVGMLPAVAPLEALIGGLGIGNGDHVVIVPAGVSAVDYGSATRVYWTFKVLGHDRVSILDGGHAGWVRAGRALERGPVRREPVTFTATFRPRLVASAADVEAASQGGRALVDNRPTDQFLGRAKHPKAARAGAVPGAHNVPQDRFFDPATGRFADVASLAASWRDEDLAGDAQITYCNTGHWASLGWFAASELLGRKDVRLYDGSMVDWTRDPARPVRAASR